MPDTKAPPENAFLGVPVEMTISVGKARPLISELLSLSQGAIIPLDSRIDDPVEIYIGEKLIARGELQEIEGEAGKLGVRLTEVVDLQNGF
ncbi:MAG: FliM/FliN family flagellar motor C-terminal domain-containing protein [Rhodobacteraceae bacterium]|nr:FliM/FliN family flagellar motor C-terminal domain-containing protein [Paracoccaceae bacterium]